MERKMPEHRMSFGNRIRKLFGRDPKDEVIISKDEQGNSTKTVKYDRWFRIKNMSISTLAPDGSSTKTEYKSDGSGQEIIMDGKGTQTKITDWNSNGHYTEEIRASDGSYRYLENGKPYTGERILSTYTRRLKPDRASSAVTYKASVGLYINGQQIGPTLINPRLIRDPEEKKNNSIEDTRQWALLNSAEQAIASGNKEKLNEIIEKANKQKELLDTPAFQQLLEMCHEQTKTSIEFTEMLEKSNYMEMNPISKLEAALARGRENIAATKETTTAEAPAPEQEKTTQEVSRTALAQEALKQKAYE